MPLNFQNIRTRIVVAKAATIADFYNMDTAGGTWSIDASGMSATAGTSNIAQVLVGGFNDQKITAVLKTSTASSRLGVILRYLTSKSPNATYYYGQVQAGTMRITKVVDGTFTNLASAAYTITAGTEYTFTFSAIGSALSLTVDDLAGNTATITVADSSIAGPGCMGFRSGPTTSTQISCKNWQAEEQ